MKIGIIVAMEKELQQLLAQLSDLHRRVVRATTFYEGHFGRHEVVVMQCGIGKVNAAAGAMLLLLEEAPDKIISTGVAGGAAPTLQVGEVVVASSCAYHDVYCGSDCAYGQFSGMPAVYPTDEAWVNKALQLSDRYPIKSGLTVTGDWFVDSKEKMQEILTHFPEAAAVDMESCAIAQVCFLYHVPFVSFRIISDVPLNDTKAAQYFDFWNHISEQSFEVTQAFLQAL